MGAKVHGLLPRRSAGGPTVSLIRPNTIDHRECTSRARASVIAVVIIVADIVMIVCGLVMPLTVRLERVAFLVLAVACFFFVIAHSLRALADVLRSADLGAAERGREGQPWPRTSASSPSF